MFSFAVLALAAASASAHSISHVRRHHVPRTQPSVGWATGYLEGYDVYHARYQAIGCGNKHNTTFFDLCCHPLLATETVEKNRPACCAVGATAACPGTAPHSAAAPAKSSAKTPAAPAKTPAKTTVAPAKTPAKTTAAPAAPAKTTAAQDDGDEDCDDEDDDNDTTDDGDYDDEDDGEDCDDEDEGESTTHAAPTSTKAAPTTSSHTAAPPATSTHTTPKETTTQAATTHTTPKSTPVPTTSASTGDKSSSGGFTTGGFGTWFTQNGVAGACGKVHKDSEFVVALQTKTYANGANCGRKIQLCDMTTNKCVNGVVADECPTCTNPESVDMSEAMFEALAALSVGEFKIQWKFIGS